MVDSPKHYSKHETVPVYQVLSTQGHIVDMYVKDIYIKFSKPENEKPDSMMSTLQWPPDPSTLGTHPA